MRGGYWRTEDEHCMHRRRSYPPRFQVGTLQEHAPFTVLTFPIFHRLFISIGGDDITRTFASFLLANKFPYADINLSRAYDWRLAQELKEKWCTMNEADISVQVYDFFVRLPGDSTKKYQCKVYDEVFLAPLCLVYPSILNAKEKTENFKAFANPNVIDDVADDSQVMH